MNIVNRKLRPLIAKISDEKAFFHKFLGCLHSWRSVQHLQQPSRYQQRINQNALCNVPENESVIVGSLSHFAPVISIRTSRSRILPTAKAICIYLPSISNGDLASSPLADVSWIYVTYRMRHPGERIRKQPTWQLQSRKPTDSEARMTSTGDLLHMYPRTFNI